jgi:hypothetical protein
MNWWLTLKHHMLCERDALVERRVGELYIRCVTCGLRSPGVTVGPFKPTRHLAGDPARHMLVHETQ